MQTKLKTEKEFTAGLRPWRPIYVALVLLLAPACSDFVQVDLPNDRLTSEVVFEDPAIAETALKGIYIKMRDAGLLSAGPLSGANVLLGLYTDDLEYYATTTAIADFQDHGIRANNSHLLSWWNSAYNQIYAANDVIEGVNSSTTITAEDSNRFIGEALFIRGFLHLYLVELFGDIPYITTTDYIANTTVSRMPRAMVYEQLITDLTDAHGLLPAEDISGERTRPYKAVAMAVLARAYLYTGQWTEAELAATGVIDEFGALEPNLNKVFLKDATSTIWQFKPNTDAGNAREGEAFIFNLSFQGQPSRYALNGTFVANAFETGDQRKANWIQEKSNNDGGVWYHAYKYKIRTVTSTSEEYSIQLRLAEQYLIRAEARARLNDKTGARADLNRVRNRAGLGNTPAATLETLLDKILEERRVEFFTEKGHRWLDLKRLERAKEVLMPIKPGWRDTDVLFPIPEAEILLNPNLLPQNLGY